LIKAKKILTNNKAPIFYTVDFEDFSFDLCRAIGTSSEPRLRTESLRKSYKNISELLPNDDQAGAKITFFCTGIMADKYPELIREIAADGHEIACHGDFHDDIFRMSVDELYTSLNTAKQKLSEISQSEIRGFRAPRFSIEKDDYDRLDVISKVFDYDSSLHFRSSSELNEWVDKCPVKLVEFPVPIQTVGFLNMNVKTGGSYLKLFPVSFVKTAIKQSLNENITPIIYLHPYDIFYDYDLLLDWSELKGGRSRVYWYFRQTQWAGLFNWSQKRKLKKIFREFGSLGRLDSLL
jgi:peptidoglycan/xylan/chitin deacetylase (PgdA/CDA1 family)